MRRPFLLLLVVLLAVACTRDRGDDDGMESDSGAVAVDGGPRSDGGPGMDASRDSGGGPVAMCDSLCLSMPGAMCCTTCGCSAEVRCTPICPDGYTWDCEIGCCFDYDTLTCFGP